jgi:hypothetical protein
MEAGVVCVSSVTGTQLKGWPMAQPLSIDELVVGLTHPRVDRTKLHSLRDIVTPALCDASAVARIIEDDPN